MRFMVNFIYDEEYGGYVADVPELPGCMSQGKTVEEATSNVKEAIAVYLQEHGSDSHPSTHPALTTIVEV
jgi:predicted RNase H-like HicB family nuclease